MQRMQWCVVAVALLVFGGLAPRAHALDRLCLSYVGGSPDDYVNVDGKLMLPVGLAAGYLYDPDLKADNYPWPAAAWNYVVPPSRPNRCPAFFEVLDVQGGPVLFSHPWYDSETVFYAVRRNSFLERLADGSCRTVVDSWTFGDPGKDGTGLVCSRSIGPLLTVPSRTVQVGRKLQFKIQATRASGPAIVGLPMDIRLLPAAPTGSLACDPITDSAGAIACRYTAPQRPMVDTVEAASMYAHTATGTITVTPPKIVLGFFNGIRNTSKQAQDGLEAISKVVGSTHGDIEIRYEKFYNQNGHNNGSSDAQDFAETFIQISNELDGVLSNRWEHYWELLSGSHHAKSSLTRRLLDGLREGGSALSDLIDAAFDSMFAGFIKGLSQLLSNPPTAADTTAHLAKLQALADEGNDFVLAGHSQGNMFVNLAHDGLRDTRPDAKRAVVHLAPVAPTLRGDYMTADIDLVINGLINLGRNIVPSTNFWIFGGRGSDPLGHKLAETYLDDQREGSASAQGQPRTTPRAHAKNLIVKALDQISAP